MKLRVLGVGVVAPHGHGDAGGALVVEGGRQRGERLDRQEEAWRSEGDSEARFPERGRVEDGGHRGAERFDLERSRLALESRRLQEPGRVLGQAQDAPAVVRPEGRVGTVGEDR